MSILEGMTNDDLLLFGVVWLIGCTIVAWIAHSQGRPPLTWFVIAVLFTPVLGFVTVILSAPKKV